MKDFKIIIILFLVLGYSCSSTKDALIPTNNKGGYKLVISDNNKDLKTNEVLIFGKVVDLKTNKPLSHTQILIGCLKFETSANGEYSFKIKKSDVKRYLEVSSLGYKKIETSFLNFNLNNYFNINFYLAEDDKPLIDCI